MPRARLEFRCIRCGVTFESGKKDAKYCSHSCANARGNVNTVILPCKYNGGIDCSVEECHRCGWDPEVAGQRLREIKRKLGVEA